MNVRTLYCGCCSRTLCGLMAIVMATGPVALVAAEQPIDRSEKRGASGTATSTTPDTGKLDLSYVSPQAVLVAVLRPRALLTSTAAAAFPVEVASAAGLEYLGIDPANIDQLTIYGESKSGTLNYGVVARCSSLVDLSRIPERLKSHTKQVMLNDKPYLESQQRGLPSYYSPDDHTLLVGPDLMLRRAVDPDPDARPGWLVNQIREVPGGDDFYLACDAVALQAMIASRLSGNRELPPELKPFIEMLKLVSSVDLTLNLTHDGVSQLIVHAKDETSAERLLPLINAAVEQFPGKPTTELRDAIVTNSMLPGPIAEAALKYLDRMGPTSQPHGNVQQTGSDISLFHIRSSEGPEQRQAAKELVAMLITVLLPPIQASRGAGQRNESMSHLKQLLLAVHAYADRHRLLPTNAIYDAEGKPLLSWRVAMLPYLEEQALYDQFHLDESWDSAHNRELIAKMPAVFANPSLNSLEGKTNYLAVVGKQCAFSGTPNGLAFAQISDGTSKTVFLVEADADQAVEWTKPADWNFNPEQPTIGLGHFRKDGWLAGWGDGRAGIISNQADPEIVKSVFTRNGREVHNLH
jgi:uncharacterized protein DUF1559